MKKWIFSGALFLCSSFSQTDLAPQMMMDTSATKSPKSFRPNEAQYIEPYTVNAGYLAVKGMKIQGFDSESLKKMEKAFDVLEVVVNSEEFKNRVINFKNKEGKRLFKSNKNLTNEQIYNLFMEGRETLQQNTPGEMNFYLSLYYKRFSKVIGWTNGKINTININWKYFKNFSPDDVAGNLAHEWTHKIGFDHVSASEHDSAPYAIGYIVNELAAKYLKGEDLI